jgi:hypothetical protein
MLRSSWAISISASSLWITYKLRVHNKQESTKGDLYVSLFDNLKCKISYTQTVALSMPPQRYSSCTECILLYANVHCTCMYVYMYEGKRTWLALNTCYHDPISWCGQSPPSSSSPRGGYFRRRPLGGRCRAFSYSSLVIGCWTGRRTGRMCGSSGSDPSSPPPYPAPFPILPPPPSARNVRPILYALRNNT